MKERKRLMDKRRRFTFVRYDEDKFYFLLSTLVLVNNTAIFLFLIFISFPSSAGVGTPFRFVLCRPFLHSATRAPSFPTGSCCRFQNLSTT